MKQFLFPAILFLSVVIFSSRKSQAQETQNFSTPDSMSMFNKVDLENVQWYTMFANIPRDWERWYDVSFRKERINEWLFIGGLTLATYLTDDITYTPSEKFYHSSTSAKNLSDFCANIGDGTTQFALAGSFGAYGLLFKDQKALRTGSQIVQAVLASGAVIQVLKHITGRESPFVRTTPFGVWKILPNQIDYHRRVPQFDAYPSGHICTSIATVIVIAENYPGAKWIRPAGYAFTTLVGLGMLSNGIHWVSDYPLGLFIGYYFGMLAAHPEGMPVMDSGDGKLKVHILPNITPLGTGVSLTMSF
ncbi:MAG: phosphatase PAP2 family protein [Ignavibacteriales bacterium]|nr:phosphatase PAP2 family protein [Ignavibacteriales bacterium]